MNILFIFADQMHRYAMRCMGTSDIITPNIDRLAREGVLFRNAYANCPICTASRVNMLTGMYSCRFNYFSNLMRIPEGTRTLADALNDGGYRTSYVGKWHIGGTGNRPIPRELRGGFTDFIGYQAHSTYMRDVCFYDEDNREHRFDAHRTDVTTGLAIERLRKISGGKFVMFVSFQAPHYPMQPAPEYDGMYRGVRIQRRPNCRDIDPYTPHADPPSPPPDECPEYQRYANNLDEYLRLYYAMVTQVDAGVGRLLDELDRLGHADDTVVVFTSDHGDMQGAHGLKNKKLPFEESTGIPLVARVPDGAVGVVSDALVSCVDFFPTCVEWAGLPVERNLPGTSFAPLTRGEPQTLDGPLFSERGDWKMVRYGNLKLVTDTNGFTPTHFYDLAEDPYEMANLIDDPRHAAHIQFLCTRILNWQREHAHH